MSPVPYADRVPVHRTLPEMLAEICGIESGQMRREEASDPFPGIFPLRHRGEMGVEAAVGQSRLLHHVGHADPRIALAAERLGRDLHDPFVGRFLACRLSGHGRNITKI